MKKSPRISGKLGKVLNLTVIVASLGYFVDMFDLTLFGVVRVASLKAMGVSSPTALLENGVFLLNLQMIGMLVGGVLWGILGDKKGRLSVLFGSILLYSVANIANAFATSVEAYGALRFVAGLGLAGELGAAITLVSEVLSPEVRGYGTTLVATLGLLGAVAAALIGQHLGWKQAYLIGGGLGLLLLLARFGVLESGMFQKTEKPGKAKVRRGDLRILFSGGRLQKYLACVCIGIPIWFITGILMTFAPEITGSLQLSAPVSAGNALLYGSIGLTLGDLASGMLSQLLKSRRKAILAFMLAGALLTVVYANCFGASPQLFYSVCFLLGVCAGYWAVFVTTAAEQFGTNIRATVATTVPNFVRGSVVLVTLAFSSLKAHFTVLQSAMLVGTACFVLAFAALARLPETYGSNLDYLEE